MTALSKFAEDVERLRLQTNDKLREKWAELERCIDSEEADALYLEAKQLESSVITLQNVWSMLKETQDSNVTLEKVMAHNTNIQIRILSDWLKFESESRKNLEQIKETQHKTTHTLDSLERFVEKVISWAGAEAKASYCEGYMTALNRVNEFIGTEGGAEE